MATGEPTAIFGVALVVLIMFVTTLMEAASVNSTGQDGDVMSVCKDDGEVAVTRHVIKTVV